jgi:hypothetical protein
MSVPCAFREQHEALFAAPAHRGIPTQSLVLFLNQRGLLSVANCPAAAMATCTQAYIPSHDGSAMLLY